MTVVATAVTAASRSTVLDIMLRRRTHCPRSFHRSVVLFRRPLGTFHQQLCRYRDIVTAKQKIEPTKCFFPQIERPPEEFCSLVPALVQQ
jgi:hypothetical protein